MSKKTLGIVLAGIVLLAAGGQVYKWVDKEGVVHYGERPPAHAEAQEVQLAPPPTEEQVRQSQDRLERLLAGSRGRDERLERATGIPSASQLIGYWMTVAVGNLETGKGKPLFPYRWHAFYADGTLATAMSTMPKYLAGKQDAAKYLDNVRAQDEYVAYRMKGPYLIVEATNMVETWKIFVLNEDVDQYERGDVLMFLIDQTDGHAISFVHLRRL